MIPKPLGAPPRDPALSDNTAVLLRKRGNPRGYGPADRYPTLAVGSSAGNFLVTGERTRVVGINDVAHLFTGSVPDGQGWYTGPEDEPVSGITIDFDEVGSGGSAITPDGFVLSVPADGVGFGVATHRLAGAWTTAPDCFVTGTAVLTPRTGVLP